jgi:hypothetical protein
MSSSAPIPMYMSQTLLGLLRIWIPAAPASKRTNWNTFGSDQRERGPSAGPRSLSGYGRAPWGRGARSRLRLGGGHLRDLLHVAL